MQTLEDAFCDSDTQGNNCGPIGIPAFYFSDPTAFYNTTYPEDPRNVYINWPFNYSSALVFFHTYMFMTGF